MRGTTGCIGTIRLMASVAGDSGVCEQDASANSRRSLNAFGWRQPGLLESGLGLRQLQEFFFGWLNLALIGALLVLQELSRLIRGRPSAAVVIVLALGFLIQAVQLAS